jgi:hypothetical protein
MGFVYRLLCATSIVLVIVVTFGSLMARKWRRNRKSREPFNELPLRPPGESLRRELSVIDDKLVDAVLFYVVGVIGAIVMVTGVSSAQYAKPLDMLLIGMTLSILFVFILVFTIRMWRLQTARWALSLGYDGERYVGQKLVDELTPLGYRVFHDIEMTGASGAKYNIDHVVVGPRGLFVIETKAWRKLRNCSVDISYAKASTPDKPSFDAPPGFGKRMTKAYRQVLDNSSDLAKLLLSRDKLKILKEIRIRPVIAVPGWNLNGRSDAYVGLINSKNCSGYFGKYGMQELDEVQLAFVVSELEELARLREIS